MSFVALQVKREAVENGTPFRKSLCVSRKVFDRVSSTDHHHHHEDMHSLAREKGVTAARAEALWSFLHSDDEF